MGARRAIVVRGIRLVCEQCDYQADLYERIPLGSEPAEDTAGSGDPGSPHNGLVVRSAVGVSCSYLCPECREPVRLIQPLKPASGGEPAPVPRCPRCDAPLLDFATAAGELAAVSRSRTTLDLRAETAGVEQVEILLARASTLGAEVAEGSLSMANALAALRQALTHQVEQAAQTASPWAPLDETTALAGLAAALAGAPDLAGCVKLMRNRLLQAERHLDSLEQCIADEADLPGVPCPRCGIGHLLHWPIWS
jgi:hypothetical protein